MGVYHYNIYAIVGTDTSRDSFLWGKMGMGNWENKAENWSNAGESLGQITSKRPNEFSPVSAILYPAIPNPFNSSTTLTFDLLSAGEVSLIIYDIQGREVAKLETRNLKLGTNQIVWNAEGLPSGVYFVRLSVVGSRSSVQKIVLLK
jgi:hypothetical protein